MVHSGEERRGWEWELISEFDVVFCFELPITSIVYHVMIFN